MNQMSNIAFCTEEMYTFLHRLQFSQIIFFIIKKEYLYKQCWVRENEFPNKNIRSLYIYIGHRMIRLN